jgi:uncharacterized protein YeaO (DUF488 family)
MALSIVRLGSPRVEGEGIRIGTVRRPPRGVPKDRYGADDFFDLWFPNLAPSEGLLKRSKAEGGLDDERAWKTFARAYLAEMKDPGPRHDLDLLAALSHRTDLSVGCYCKDESRCHRSLLRDLLAKRGAEIRNP